MVKYTSSFDVLGSVLISFVVACEDVSVTISRLSNSLSEAELVLAADVV